MMADNQNEKSFPKATHTGILEIGDAKLPCAVLKGGKRMLTQEGFLKALGRAPKAKGGTGASVDRLPAFMAAKNLKPFINTDLEASTRPIRFRNPQGVLGYGYSAELLPRVCQVYLEARDAGALHPSQLHIAQVADILIRGLAHVGIIALIDEATGFQDERVSNALEKILNEYLLQEKKPYIGMFPLEFYRQLYRLNGWQWTPENARKRPGVIGKWTNDIIYDRLAPGILKGLKERNPTIKPGRRKFKHFQFLTDKVGDPALKSHFDGVMALQRATSTMRKFWAALNRAYPRRGDTISLDLGESDVE